MNFELMRTVEHMVFVCVMCVCVFVNIETRTCNTVLGASNICRSENDK